MDFCPKSITQTTLGFVLFATSLGGISPAFANPSCPVRKLHEQLGLSPVLSLADFDLMHLVQVRLKPGISEKSLTLLNAQLQALGFKSLNGLSSAHPLIGMADPKSYVKISRLKNVLEVRTESAKKIRVWKNGTQQIRVAKEIEETLTDAQIWQQMPKKITGNPPRDFEAIRNLADQQGITYVISGRKPETQAELDAVQELVGATVFYADDLPADSGIIKIPGIALHIGLASRPLLVRGDVNFTLGYGDLYAGLNKVTEAYWIRGVDPKAMAPSLSFADLLKKHPDPEFEKDRTKTLEEIKLYLKTKKSTAKKMARKEIKKDLNMVVTEFFSLATLENPEGAFIKWKADYASRESDSIITTFSTPPERLTKDFLKDLDSKEPPGTPGTARMSTQSEVLDAILNHPDDILVQAKLPLKKTARGNLMEFRVDVMSGQVMNSGFRFGMEYFPEESKEAAKFVETFLEKLPPEQKYFSGGFDVSKLEDGNYVIIESNPGVDSGMMDPRNSPIDSNKDLQTLLAHSTPLLTQLEKIYQDGVDAQVQMLKKLPVAPRDLNSIKKIPKYQFLAWLRERYLEDWVKAPTEEAGQQVMKKLKSVVRKAGLSGDEDMDLILDTSADYIQRQLLGNTVKKVVP